MIEQEYGRLNRFGRDFGQRSLLGDHNDNFFDKPIDEQAKEMAWSEGCPVKDRIIKNRGAEAARNRYGEIIFTSQIILDEAKAHNPKLYKRLTVNLSREIDEPIGEHEPNSVPSAHVIGMLSSNTPGNYALPRILVKQFGDRTERSQERIIEGLNFLEQSVKQATSSLELVAILANKCSKNVPLDALLHEAFSKGYLAEENTFKLFEKLLKEFKVHAPKLYKRYQKLSPSERDSLGIATI